MYTRVQRNGKKPADSTTNQLASRPFKVESRPQDDANENTVVQNKELPSYKKSCLLTNIEILPPGGYQQPLQPKLEIQPQRLDASTSYEPQGVKSGGDFLTINNDVIQNKEQPTDLKTQTDNSWVLGITRGASSQPPAPPLGIQMKLTIGQPGDKYEQEADRVAADVVQRINEPQSENVPAQLQTKEEQSERIQRDIAPMIPKFSIFPPGVSSPPPPPAIQMKLSIGEPGEEREPTLNQPIYTPVQPLIQRVNIGGMAATPDVEAGIQRARGGGQPLADSIREPMEQAFGADFSGVRVHTDAQADQLNQSIQAKAFTTGQDVFFRQGAYEPGSQGGQELLAHELTHVVQQRGREVEKSGQRTGNEIVMSRGNQLAVTQKTGMRLMTARRPKTFKYRSYSGRRRVEGIERMSGQQYNLGRGRANHVRHIIPRSDIQAWMMKARERGNQLSEAGRMRRIIYDLIICFQDHDLAQRWLETYELYELGNTDMSMLQIPQVKGRVDGVWREVEWHNRNIFYGLSGVNMAIQNRFDAGKGGKERFGESKIRELHMIWRRANTLLGLAPTAIIGTRVYSVHLKSDIIVMAAAHNNSRKLKAVVGRIQRSDYVREG